MRRGYILNKAGRDDYKPLISSERHGAAGEGTIGNADAHTSEYSKFLNLLYMNTNLQFTLQMKKLLWRPVEITQWKWNTWR